MSNNENTDRPSLERVILPKETKERIREAVRKLEELEAMKNTPVSKELVKICQCKACWDINKQITYHNSLSNRCPVCGATTNYQIPVPLAENDPARAYTRDRFRLPSNHPAVAVIEMRRQNYFRVFRAEFKGIPYSYLEELIQLLKDEIKGRPNNEHREPIPAYEFKDFNAKANLEPPETTNPLSDEDIY